jgi:uncharacterized FlaG/YvyC family protein
MDIGSVGRLKASAVVLERAENDPSRQTHADRDAQGQSGQRDQAPIKQLTPEQEGEALAKLNSQSDFVKAGLRAELVRDGGRFPFILVKKLTGEEVRRIPYEQIIRIFLDKKEDSSKGLLFKSRA